MTDPGQARPTTPVPSTAPAEPGERYVTVLGDERWPALVDVDDPADRWNGWLSPRFRPDVARAIARWQAADVATDDEQDQLVLSPDQRTIVHLVPDDEAPDADDRRYGPRGHSVWVVYPLTSHVAIGAWHWCWYLADPDPDPQED